MSIVPPGHNTVPRSYFSQSVSLGSALYHRWSIAAATTLLIIHSKFHLAHLAWATCSGPRPWSHSPHLPCHPPLSIISLFSPSLSFSHISSLLHPHLSIAQIPLYLPQVVITIPQLRKVPFTPEDDYCYPTLKIVISITSIFTLSSSMLILLDHLSALLSLFYLTTIIIHSLRSQTRIRTTFLTLTHSLNTTLSQEG